MKSLELFIALSFFFSTSSSLAATTTFTSIASKDCAKVSKKVDVHFEKLGLYGDECPAPGRWRLFLVVGGDRSWIDIGKNGALWTTEQEVVYKEENFFGYFPNVTSKKVEWRMDKGAPSALIFPVTAQNPEQVGTNMTRFFVISLNGEEPHFCGTAKTIEEARAVAGKSKYCNISLQKRPFQMD